MMVELEDKYIHNVPCCNKEDCDLFCEHQELKDRIDKAIEYIKKHRQIYDIDGSVEPKIDDFSILASPKHLIDLLKGDKK